LIAIGDSRRGNLSYRYDPVGRLLEANSRLGRETFAFDPAGNIGDPSPDVEGGAQAPGRITNRVAIRAGSDGRSMAGKLMDNLLKDYAGTHYKWDERGNLIERSRNGEKTVFTWDGYNRMRSAETFGETTSFSYDPLGRRIAKRTRHACTLFGWDGDTLAFESTQSAEGQQEQAWRGDSVHYIHEPGSFVPLVQIRLAQAVVLSQTTDVKALMADNGGRYDIELDPLWNGEQSRAPAPFAKEEIGFYQCDHLGTPQELTDHEGRVAWSASYKAWGEARQAISEAGRKAGLRNPIRFQGQYWDEETGLHYNRYRYFDPAIGRFVSTDPIKLEGGFNAYAYAPNPIQWSDPLGLSSKKVNAQSSLIPACRNRRQALNSAKDLAGIPRSQQASSQWQVGNDPRRRGGKNYVYSENPAEFGRFYEYVAATGAKKVVVEHTSDPRRGPHAHAGEAKGSDPRNYDFRSQRYQKIDDPRTGDHHVDYGC